MITDAVAHEGHVSKHPSHEQDPKVGANVVMALPFASITETGEMLGGMPFDAVTRYINATGFVQVSKVRSDGTLRELEQGTTDADAFFVAMENDLAKLKESGHKDATIDTDPITVSEYYPPGVDFRVRVSHRGYLLASYSRDELGGVAASLLSRLRVLIAETVLEPAEPGIYVRALRLPRFLEEYPEGIDPKKLVDVVVDPSSVVSDPDLQRIFGNESEYVRVGPVRKTLLVGNIFVLSLERPLRIKIGQDVYQLAAYVFDGYDE